MPDDSTDEHPAERRHRQPGRRSSDADAFRVASNAAGEDWLFPRWTVGRTIKWLTLVSLAIGVFAALSSFFSAKLATRQEVTSRIDSVKSDVGLIRQDVNEVKRRQDQAETVHQLLIPMARLQCLQMQKWESGTLATAAGLPCDDLLQGRTR